MPSAVALGQKGRTLFMGFPLGSPCGKSGLVSLYPRHRVYLKEPKPPLNKFVEISTTAGRFCSRCHVYYVCSVFLCCLYSTTACFRFPGEKVANRFLWSPLRDLNPRPPLGKRISCPPRRRRHLATWTGLEPATSGETIRRSSI